MPQSPASDKILSDVSVTEDDILPDAPEQVLDPVNEEGIMVIVDDASPLELPAGAVLRTDVKLEDLFSDANGDEYDEFSGTGNSTTINESSPPTPL